MNHTVAVNLRRLTAAAVLPAVCAAALYAGTDAAAFLKSGVGARALAMGGAYVSIAEDPSAMYWNPAGLAKIDKFAFTMMSQSAGASKWDTQNDIAQKYQFMGAAFPFSLGPLEDNAFGFGMINAGLNNVTYSYLDPAGKIVRDTFEDSENAFFFSWAMPVMLSEESFYVGASLKYITQKFSRIDGADAAGYDLDFGLLYTMRNMSAGLLVQRGADVSWSNGRKDTAPLLTKLGVSNLFRLGGALTALASADAVQRKNEPLTVNAGGELGFKKKMGSGKSLMFEGAFFRAGLEGYAVEDRDNSASKINANSNFTMGLGVNFTFWGYAAALDYAAGSYALGGKNRVSINLYF